jgi:hypothetical protein
VRRLDYRHALFDALESDGAPQNPNPRPLPSHVKTSRELFRQGMARLGLAAP